jgi:protein O-GlcNAc transferase
MTRVGPDRLLEKAEACLLRQDPRRAAAIAHSILARHPVHARALHIAGLAAASAGDGRAAVRHLSEAARLAPSARSLTDLASVLYSLDCLAEAETCGRRALDIDALHAPAINVLARIEVRRGRDHRACTHLRALGVLRPNDPRVLARLSLAEYAVGNVPEAIRLLRNLIDAGEASALLHSEYVSAHLYDPRQTGESIRRTAREWAERCCVNRPARAVSAARLHTDRKLRIGYLSGDFGATPSRYFVLPVLGRHSRGFEITCYHTRHRDDVYTASFRNCADRWHDCADLDDGEIASRIQADEIDILVDLSGHLRHHRLSVFALRPAPVQVAYPNYLGTTGMPAISHIFTDAWVCPPGFESQYSEQPLPLGAGHIVYEPPPGAPPVGPLPYDELGIVTFGLFQWPGKLNPGVWDAVAAILHASAGSQLLLHYSSAELDEPDSPARLSVESELAKRQIARERLVFRGSVSKDAYLTLLGGVDIALDTFPFNGVTTTCECLLMGVPVTTLAGSTHSSRIGYEILDRVGLGALVASDTDQYVRIATALAADRARLRDMRCQLRPMFYRSSVCNSILLVRELEKVYRLLWQHFVEENR